MTPVIERNLYAERHFYESDQKAWLIGGRLTLTNYQSHFAETFKGLIIEGDFS
jgi:hypothetical protein